MTTYSVVTTFSQKGYEVYGRTFIQSFIERWPKDIPLHVFYEGEVPGNAPPRGEHRVYWWNLNEDEDRAKFLREAPPDHPTQYRLMGRRFCHKVFALTAAPRDTDWLIWLDADTETFQPVTHDLLAKVCPDGVVASYLGRDHWEHSECGFVAYNMRLFGGTFLDDFRRLYVSKELYWLPQHHDSFVFDALRRAHQRQGAPFCNLTPNSHGLDVFPQSPLHPTIQHYKGPKLKREHYGDVA